MRVAALVVGAGRGERLQAGTVPAEAATLAGGKAFAPLAGRPLLLHALEALAACEAVDRVVPVVAEAALERARALVAEASAPARAKLAAPVAGGAERQDSVAQGLAALPREIEWVAVHDAARPLVRPEDVARVVAEAFRHGAALLAVPMPDTLKRVAEGRVVATPERAAYYAAQTPQVFRREVLDEALAKARAENLTGTDDAALVERLGVEIRVVSGDPENFKITTREDLERAGLVLARRAREERA